MTTDNFTVAARAEAEGRYNRTVRRNKTADEWLDEGRASGFASGAEWARTHLASQEPTDAAQIIDEHRTTGRWVGDGVRVECACGHISPGSHPGGPQTEEDNAHRDADRKHAAHVADMLARAARRVEEDR